MSQILSRHLKIYLEPERIISIPRAQILHLRHGADAKTKLDRIEIRVSTGELVLLGSELDDFWVRLVNGEVADVHLKANLEPGRIEQWTTTLDYDLSPPPSEAKDKAELGAA